jgi:hypothetical protein
VWNQNNTTLFQCETVKKEEMLRQFKFFFTYKSVIDTFHSHVQKLGLEISHTLMQCFNFEHLSELTASHKIAHSLLLALFCFPLRSCVTGLLLFLLISGMDGTRTVSASCCCWLWLLLLLLYKELLNRSLTTFPIVFPLRRLVNLPKAIPPTLPALPLALRDWWPIWGSVTAWKSKINLWIFHTIMTRVMFYLV